MNLFRPINWPLHGCGTGFGAYNTDDSGFGCGPYAPNNGSGSSFTVGESFWDDDSEIWTNETSSGMGELNWFNYGTGCGAGPISKTLKKDS